MLIEQWQKWSSVKVKVKIIQALGEVGFYLFIIIFFWVYPGYMIEFGLNLID